VFHALDARPHDTGVERTINATLLFLILLNASAVVAETVESLPSDWREGLRLFEVFSVVVFSIEYLLRLWTCVVDPRYQHPIAGRIRYAFSPLGLVDLIAIAPFFLPWRTTVDLRYIRVFRLIRLLRLFKVARYTKALHTLGHVFRRKREELAIAGFLAMIAVLCASSSIYFLERDAQPEAFSSIPAAMWWAISTLTTVGYGDIYPVTPGGKLLGAITDVLGIAMFALPTGILAAGFAEELQRHRRDQTRACPHCGGKIPDVTGEPDQRLGRAAGPEV